MQTGASTNKYDIRPANEFAIEVDPKGALNMLQFKGHPVVPVQGTVVEAQFRFPDQSTLVLVGDHTPFEELLTILLIGPNLQERDRVLVGGAYPQGFLAFAAPEGPDEVGFCWHDLELVVRVRQYWNWFSMRRRWLKLRDTVPQRGPAEPAPPSPPGKRPFQRKARSR